MGKIESINIEKAIVLAPMDDITDMAFRLICKKLGADIVYTEFTSIEAIIRKIKRSIKRIHISEEERPIGIQLFGSSPTSMQEAIKITEKMKPDFIDINCGCWVKTHVGRGEGAALLKDLKAMEKILRAAVKATALPVTMKTRLGWDKNNIVILEAAKIAEQAGIKAIAVHCRTRSQAYKGDADWNWLEKIKKNVSIPVIGNGDIVTVEDIKTVFDTGCDAVMIGRGAISNPWIFTEAKHFLKTGEKLPPATLQERIELCISHLKLSIQLNGLREGILRLRKHYSGYLKGFPCAAQLRAELMQLTDLDLIIKNLYQFMEKNTS